MNWPWSLRHMASVEWRKIPTVLKTDEILDKAFRKASKQSDTVEDPDKYHRVRKQMNKMVQSAASIIDSTLIAYVERWPSLNALSDFDQALVDAAVGSGLGEHEGSTAIPQMSMGMRGALGLSSFRGLA